MTFPFPCTEAQWDALPNKPEDCGRHLIRPGNGRNVQFLANHLRNNLALNVKDFGAQGDGATDDTVAIQATIDAAIAAQCSTVLIPDGIFLVSNVVVDSANGLNIEWRGLLLGNATVATESVFTLKNSSDVSIFGKMWISAGYNTNYASAFCAYTDNATQVSNVTIVNPVVVGAAVAMTFGRDTEPNALISEISVHGGFFYGCPEGVRAVGTQTIVSFNGSNILANSLGGNAAWQAITQYAIVSVGASVTVTGGEIQHNQTTTGACIDIQPVTDAVFGNLYGSVHVINSAIESASKQLTATNPGAIVPVAGSGRCVLTNCFGYHSQDLFSFITSVVSYTGLIKVKDCAF